MPLTHSNDPEAFWSAIRTGVQAALRTLPADAATVDWDDEHRCVQVTPRTPDAAPVTVGVATGDEVSVQAGRTHFWSFGNPDDIARDLEQLLSAIFAGRIESARIGAKARITTDTGVVKVGEASVLPMPWAWRRPQRYAAYA